MKNLLLKLTARPNLFSVILLGLFLLLAWGSIEIYETQYKGDGIYEESYSDIYGTITRTGKRDHQGRWQGKIVSEYTALNSEDSYIEEVTYVDGIRNGLAKEIYPNGETRELNYSNDRLNEDPLKVTVTGYNELVENYPFVIFAFNAFGFEDSYIERYIDSIEYLMGTYIFEFEDFDYNFDNASEAVRVKFDTIDNVREDLAAWDGIYPYKSDEFRLAVMDYYIEGDNSLYDIVTAKYPAYLSYMNLQEVSNNDFEQFCSQFEDSLATYAELDIEEPLFSDSVDARIYAIIYSFNFAKKAATSVKTLSDVQTKDSDITELRKILREHQQPISKAATPEDIGSIILNRMIAAYDRADFVRNAVRYAYMDNHGILALPYLATELVSHNSETSVTLKGHIVDDGGAIVTSSGIAWGSKFNPTIDGSKLESNESTGSFEFLLADLIEGNTYYARTYATNSVGTSYGNCISFKAEEVINNIDDRTAADDLSIYPNPSNGIATLSFKVNTSGAVIVNIFDLKGALVHTRNLGIRTSGNNTVPIYAEFLKNGVYTCQVTINSTTRSIRFLVQK